ncbi:MAG TPA: D-alanyl-D-alanine carboxypeptidase/D-alanyl-D-alanine-endopeptidase [Gemmatimonadaceae bacterium]|nr:D-alanyl-D-alanine carboxypeptidase/D-alanyl-D-alanine-endopeptidase [Gemmatimonadaceae bacterium]
MVSRGAIATRPTRASWSSPKGTDALASDLAAALAQHTRSGRWGVIVVSLARGDTLFQSNPDAMMQPASTMKMYTAAMALDRFGPDYRFRTAVLHDGQLGPNGVLQGNLYLRGSGDPSLSPRLWPDSEPMDVLAQRIAAAGVKRVTGDIVADASAFDNKLVPDGWQSRYLGAAYAARVSALSLNENIVWVVVQPEGKKAVVTLDPASTTVPITSTVRVVGGSRGRIVASRRSDGSIQVRGSIGSHSGPLRYSLVVDDPPAFAAGALQASLQKAGVPVDGHVRMGETPSKAPELASIASPPLSLIVTEMNRESINLFAELLYRSAAHASGTQQVGSAETGLATLRTFLSGKVGAGPNEVDATDGSGLSVLDHVTPRSMVELLGYAHNAPWGATFHASLPLEGESGTLRHRARYTPARGNLHAKTGTTNTVASLGGYVTAKDGEILAFSFIYNGHDRWNAKLTMDQMGATLAEFVRQ